MNESKITQLFVRLSPSVMDDEMKHLQSDGVPLIYEVGQSDKLSSSTWDEPTNDQPTSADEIASEKRPNPAVASVSVKQTPSQVLRLFS